MAVVHGLMLFAATKTFKFIDSQCQRVLLIECGFTVAERSLPSRPPTLIMQSVITALGYLLFIEQ